MTEYRFRSTLLASSQSFRVNNETLSLLGDDGWDLPLAHVTRIGLVDLTTKGQRMTRLDLQAGDTKRRIALNQSKIAWHDNQDTTQFLALIRAVGAALEQAQPDARITLGEYGKARMVGFGIGVLSALGGVVILLVALANGVGTNKLISALVPVAVMIILGVITTRVYWPWTKLPEVPVAEFPKIVDFLETQTTRA